MIIRQSLWIFVYSISSIAQATKEVVLLDTRDARDYLNWYKISSDGHSHDGWGELSFEAKYFPTLLLSSLQSTLWRTQYVCDITSERRIDHWLRSPYLQRQQAQRIEIELGFSIRDCSTFQTPNEIRSCRETFELYIHQSDDEEKQFHFSSYQLIDVIAGNRFTANHYGNTTLLPMNNLTVNVKIRGISLEKSGFYLAFRDQGACVSLLYVKVFYRLCEEMTEGLLHFSETPTGASLTDIVEREGQCAINSKLIRKPLAFCKGNGQWTFQDSLLRDSCHCQEGYELLMDYLIHNETKRFRAICRVCPIGTFKSTISNEQRCERCPLNSYTKDKGSAACLCQSGYFRLNDSFVQSSCIEYPNEPQNLTIDELDQASIKISWTPRNDSYYHIQCHHSTPCESYLIYEPSQRFLLNSSVRLVGLDANRNYQIKIYAEQISTRLLSKSVHLSITTESPIVKSIEQIQCRRISFNTVVISWFTDDFDQYHFLYWSLINPSKKIFVRLTTNNFSLITIEENYFFQIRGHTTDGWTAYTKEQLISLNSMLIDENLSNSIAKRFGQGKTMLFIGPMTILSLIILVIVLALIYSKRRRSCRLKTASDCESLDYQKRQGNEHYGPDAFLNPAWSSPLWPAMTSFSRTYIDPHTYEDPNKAVIDFARELDPNAIVIESVLGGGEFGDVCRGRLRKSTGLIEIPVAIKTLKQGATEKTRLDFLSEASIMGQFRHENVIYLEGVVTKHNPIMIITEYMENGSLDAYLRTNEGNPRLDALQLTRMLRGIAVGMKYLSEMKYVHRDLAARNILVNKDLICKVADFGLSREINEDESYTTKGGKIPIRWTSIEAIDFRKFTSASDVWSFGILCWEVTSFGERPYWNWSNQDVIKAIKNSYRLPPPMACPEVLYQLMLSCWNEQYLNRPKFHEIEQQLNQLIENPNSLLIIDKQRVCFINDPDQPNLAQITSIRQWLENLQFVQINPLFVNAGYKNFSQICHWNSSTLFEFIGTRLTRDEKRRLFENFKHIRSQLLLSSSKNFLVDDGSLV